MRRALAAAGKNTRNAAVNNSGRDIMLDAGYGLRGTGCGVRVARCELRGSGCWMLGAGLNSLLS
jgi:hypothetical protein